MAIKLLSSLVMATAAYAGDLTLIADQAGIFSFLKHQEQWEKPEILWIDVDLAAGKTTRAYFSKVASGRGVCPEYLFVKAHQNRWRLIGTLPAHLERTDQLQNGFRILQTTSSIGDPETEGIKQTFGFNGERYVVQ